MSIVCMAEYQFFPMHISRVHIAILGIISVLTGIVAPIVQVDWVYLPLPVTNLRIITLFLLICMMGAFLAAVFQRWKFFNTFALLMTLCIIMTALFTLSGTLGNYRGIGESVTFSWGWIFFLGWITLFFLQQFLESHDETISFGFMWGVGSLFLLTIISIILYISLLNEKNHGDTPLLKDFFSTGTRILSWGIALSPSFLEIRSLSYDRINDVLAFHARDEGGEKIFIGKGSGTVLALSGINDVVFTNYGGNVYYLLSSLREGMSVYREWTRLLSGPLIIPIFDHKWKVLSWMSYIGDGWVWKNMNGNTRYIPHHGNDDPRVITESGDIVTVASRTGNLWNIFHNNENILLPYTSIIAMYRGHTPRETIALVKKGDTNMVVQNGEIFYPLHSSFLPGTFLSNGNDFLYQTEKYNYFQMNWNGETLSWLYEEIGPVILSESLSAYAFFARPIEHADWCLIVKKKNPVCWFEAIMHPVLSWDGWTLLFAWKKAWKWSIYRNGDALLSDTGYAPKYPSRDRFFIDPTTPSNYIFIVYDADTDTYSVNHSGKKLPQAWRWIGEDVWFTYDNRVIMTVLYDTSWHVAEFY